MLQSQELGQRYITYITDEAEKCDYSLSALLFEVLLLYITFESSYTAKGLQKDSSLETEAHAKKHAK